MRPIRAALAVIGRASSLGVTGIIPYTPEHQNGPGLSALIRGTAQNTTRISPSAAQRLGLHTAGLVCTMCAANGLPHGEAATRSTLGANGLICVLSPPRQQENAATRSSDPRGGVAAAALLSRWSQRWAASAVRHAVNLHALFHEHASGCRVRLRRCSMLPCPCVRRRRRARCGSPLVLCAQAGGLCVQALVHSCGEQLRNITG